MMKKMINGKHRTKEQWLELERRYFDAETTDEEEQELCRFLCTAEGSDQAFDALRAVMSFMQTGKQVHKSTTVARRHVTIRQRFAIAATIACLLGTSLWLSNMIDPDNVCVAYIHGVKCTDTEEVMKQMHQSMDQVGHDENDITMQGQLKSMMQTLNDETESENK